VVEAGLGMLGEYTDRKQQAVLGDAI